MNRIGIIIGAVITITFLGAASVYGVLPRVPTVAHADKGARR